MSKTPRERSRGALAPLGPAFPVWMLLIGVILPVILTVADSLGLSQAETASWIFGLFVIPAALNIPFALRYRVPLIWTPHILALIFFASLGTDVTFAELVGASMVAGSLVLLLGITGITGWVTALVPNAIVMGLIAGVIAPFVWRMFTALGTAPSIVGSALAAFVLSQRMLGTRVPAILPALGAGLIATAGVGRFGDAPPGPSLPDLIVVTPAFSLDVLAATVPVLVVLMTLQSNIPSVIYLRSQGFDPPERLITIAGGASTVASSLLGPIANSLALGAIPLVAGPGTLPREQRYRSVYSISIVAGLIGLLATMAAPLSDVLPSELIVAVAALALLGVLVTSLQDTLQGPLRLGPVVAFVVALSDISLLGLGPFFWSLALGTGFSFVLEREGWKEVSETARVMGTGSRRSRLDPRERSRDPGS